MPVLFLVGRVRLPETRSRPIGDLMNTTVRLGQREHGAGRRTRRDDHVGAEGYEVLRAGTDAVRIGGTEAEIGREIAALDPVEAQPSRRPSTRVSVTGSSFAP